MAFSDSSSIFTCCQADPRGLPCGSRRLAPEGTTCARSMTFLADRSRQVARAARAPLSLVPLGLGTPKPTLAIASSGDLVWDHRPATRPLGAHPPSRSRESQGSVVAVPRRASSNRPSTVSRRRVAARCRAPWAPPTSKVHSRAASELAVLRPALATGPARSVLGVFHPLDGFLLPRVASVLQPASGHGVRAVACVAGPAPPRCGLAADSISRRAFSLRRSPPASSRCRVTAARCPPAVAPCARERALVVDSRALIRRRVRSVGAAFPLRRHPLHPWVCLPFEALPDSTFAPHRGVIAWGRCRRCASVFRSQPRSRGAGAGRGGRGSSAPATSRGCEPSRAIPPL